MSGACPTPQPSLGIVRDLLDSVDCGVRAFSQSGYEALVQPPSPFPAIVTALLTIYVALMGWGLLSGRGPRLADTPVNIGFARNQNDLSRASLTTLLPSADRMLALTDPATGDTLMVVPGAIGHAMTAQRSFADFMALPTASGLVIQPLADDLNVTVERSRIAISRPSGLVLTPPQMPVSQSPAALAHGGDGPSYLDLARWGQASAGSFLATERKLTQDMAHRSAAQAAPARLALARFYLAHQFAAEALGLVNLMQAADPALKGDTQLTVLRAAADVMMGRYRDAHNEIAGPAFDGDRHAALVLAHKADRNHHGDAEIGAMRYRNGNAQKQHRGEVGRQRAGRLADGEGEGEAEQQGLARQRLGGERQQRAADGDAAGIAGDEIAGGGNRNAKPFRHLRQYAGDDEFGGAEREGGDEQGDERQRHGGERSSSAASNHGWASRAIQKLWTPL